MARLLFAVGLIALMSVSVRSDTQKAILDCFYQTDSLECAKRATDAALDNIEFEVTGRKSPIGFSKVFEESASLFVDTVQTIFGTEEQESPADSQDDTAVRESRKKLFSKKKKKKAKKLLKHFKKIIPFLMLIKAKFSLLLQLISTHFQFKFFIIGIVSLIINGARFWLDLRKGHAPGKVIYYEHAQHQHHYDHEDGYWGRSAENTEHDPQESAYSAWAPDQ